MKRVRIIGANPNWNVLLPMWTGEKGLVTSFDSVEILGWRIELERDEDLWLTNTPIPITVDGDSEGYAVISPSGSISLDGSHTFQNMDDLAAFLNKREKQESP